MAIAISAVILAYLLRFNFSIPARDLSPLPQVLVYVALIRMASFIIARTYAGIIRYTSTGDALRVFATVLAGSIVFALTNIVTYFFISGQGSYKLQVPD